MPLGTNLGMIKDRHQEKSPSFSLFAAMSSEFQGLKITSIPTYKNVSGREEKHPEESLTTICGGQRYQNIWVIKNIYMHKIHFWKNFSSIIFFPSLLPKTS